MDCAGERLRLERSDFMIGNGVCYSQSMELREASGPTE
jgi:hypothetical protein